MIPDRHSSGYQTIGIKGQSMSVVMDEKSAHTMSSVIYSNHRKIEAMIRELCTNATDGHIMAGKEGVPIEVMLPTLESPYLVVKDQGVGLTGSDGIKYLTSYFSSGSQFEEKPTGYYGLGSKSPHAYTDAYEIIMVKDGLKNLMLCFKDEEGVPSYRMLTQDESTDEPNGVSFKVPVMEKDFKAFARAASYILPMFAVNPEVSGVDDVIKKAFISMQAYEQGAALDLGGIKLMLSGTEILPLALQIHPSYGTLMIRMGHILYPVAINTYNKNDLISKDGHLNKLHKELKQAELSMMVDVDIVKYGMKVEPGRERIITDAKNMAIMESVAEKIVKRLYSEATKETKGKTSWQISKEVMESTGFPRLLKNDPLTYFKYQIMGAGEHVKNSYLNPLLSIHNSKLSVIRADATFVKTSSMSSSRFIDAKVGDFNPKTLRQIVLIDDKKIKMGDIGQRLMERHIAENEVHIGAGGSIKPLGIVIRPSSKKGTSRAFADKMFGKGEYITASELMGQEFDTSAHKAMTAKSVRLVRFCGYRHQWKHDDDFTLSLIQLKAHGTRAVPRSWINSYDFITMTEDQFEEKKDDMAFIFRQKTRNSPNILISNDKINFSWAYQSFDTYMANESRFYGFVSYFTDTVSSFTTSSLLVGLLNKMGVTVNDDSQLNDIHDVVTSIAKNEEILASILPSMDCNTRKMLVKTGRSTLSLSATDEEIHRATSVLLRYGLMEEKDINMTLATFETHRAGIEWLMDAILSLLRNSTLETQCLFSISSNEIRALEGTLLRDSEFSTDDIIHRLKNTLTKKQNQQAA